MDKNNLTKKIREINTQLHAKRMGMTAFFNAINGTFTVIKINDDTYRKSFKDKMELINFYELDNLKKTEIYKNDTNYENYKYRLKLIEEDAESILIKIIQREKILTEADLIEILGTNHKARAKIIKTLLNNNSTIKMNKERKELYYFKQINANELKQLLNIYKISLSQIIENILKENGLAEKMNDDNKTFIINYYKDKLNNFKAKLPKLKHLV